MSGRFDVVVVGGGQAGLAAGYELSRAGLDFVVLDAESRIGDAWRHRWDSLRLFTPAAVDGLPGMRLPAGRNHRPTKDEVAAILEHYAETFDLPVRSSTRVRAVRRTGAWISAETEAGCVTGAEVVVATGPFTAPRLPPFCHQLDAGVRQLHSVDYRRPGQLQDGPVLVVEQVQTSGAA